MTGNHDSDRALEHLLRRSADAGDPLPSCVEPETLAAWAEHALTPAEQAAVESHLSTCARCQGTVALLAAMEPAAASAPVVPFWRRSPARWVLPIGAAAAAALLWMVVPDDRSPAMPTATTTARLESDSVLPEPLREAANTPPPNGNAAAPRDQAAAPRARTAVGRAEQEAPRTEAARKAEPLEDRAAAPQADAFAPSAVAESAKAAPAAPAAPPPEIQAAPPPAAAAAAPAASAESAAAGRAAPQAVAAPLQRAFQAQPAQVLIASPDPDRRWRVGAGIIERSDDGGQSWQAMSLPAKAAPTAGAAPARNVLWLVGPAGLVLRTTDGATFQRVATPETANIISVRADDALRATVTTADGRELATNDGGTTWQAR